MKRIFVALKIDPEDLFMKICSSLASKLEHEKITWVSMQNVHLTLAFLGNTEEERVKVASIVVKQKCSGFGEFDFTIKGTGIFKSTHDPKVIWAGVEKSEQLIRLNEIIVSGLTATGFDIAEHPFRPHITLGRVRSVRNPNSFKAAAEFYKDTKIQKVHAEDVLLFESILKPAGPLYKPIGKFKLG
jgi:2'-5' RNA ligase